MKAEDLKGIAEKSKAKKLEQTIEEIEQYIVSIVRNNSYSSNCFKITTDKYSDDLYKIDKWMVKPIIEHFRSNGFKVSEKGDKKLFGWLEGLLDIYDPNEIITITWEV